MSFTVDTIKKFFFLIHIILLSTIIYLVTGLIQTGEEAKQMRTDYAELHSVQYGLFNSTIWTDKIANVVDEKIDEFDFTASSRAEIKTYVETILDTLIVEADRLVRERNAHKRGFIDSLLGSTKQMITDSLIDIKNLRKKVPEITDTIMNELERPENQKILKKVMREKLHNLTQTTLLVTDFTPYNNVIKCYGADNFKSCDIILDRKMTAIAKKMNAEMLLILSLAAILLILIVLQGNLTSISLVILSGTSLSLLIPGILLPMLNIEAKISKLYFTILDKPIIFENQILFYQTKSISNLVKLLLDSGEAKMILVGVLLVMFSVIFPTLKIFSTYLYYYLKNRIGNNPITRFFALRSSKWSMADVMVVSIFMAYLGLDGVVDNELEHLEAKSQPLNVITTNGTHLEIGFYLFLGFVLSSFVLSILVDKSRKKD